MEIKMILVCETKGKKCKQDGFHATVQNEEHLFCCENGFIESMEDFKKALKGEVNNNDDFNLN